VKDTEGDGGGGGGQSQKLEAGKLSGAWYAADLKRGGGCHPGRIGRMHKVSTCPVALNGYPEGTLYSLKLIPIVGKKNTVKVEQS